MESYKLDEAMEIKINAETEDIYHNYERMKFPVVILLNNHHKYNVPIDITIYLPLGVEVKVNDEETGIGWIKRFKVNVDGESVSPQKLYFKHNDTRYGFVDIPIEIKGVGVDIIDVKQSIRLWKMK